VYILNTKKNICTCTTELLPELTRSSTELDPSEYARRPFHPSTLYIDEIFEHFDSFVPNMSSVTELELELELEVSPELDVDELSLPLPFDTHDKIVLMFMWNLPVWFKNLCHCDKYHYCAGMFS
jgi:hypothetical protein